MSFNIKTKVDGHQSSVSAYSGNNVRIEESFHERRNPGSDQLDPNRNSYNLTTGKENTESINDPDRKEGGANQV